MCRIIVIVGYPGSGKSVLLSALKGLGYHTCKPSLSGTVRARSFGRWIPLGRTPVITESIQGHLWRGVTEVVHLRAPVEHHEQTFIARGYSLLKQLENLEAIRQEVLEKELHRGTLPVKTLYNDRTQTPEELAQELLKLFGGL